MVETSESKIQKGEDPLKSWETHKCFSPNLYVHVKTCLCCNNTVTNTVLKQK